MSGQLRVDYEGILQSKQEIETEKQNFDDLYAKLGTTINNLPNYWEGSTATNYVQQFSDLSSSFEAIAQLITDLSTQLQSISDIFEQTDNEISSQVSVV